MTSFLPSGFLLVNKPAGPTSHDIVGRLRRLTGIKKIGHAGTLDPFASGLLLCAVGREATKTINQFVKMDKEYIATIHLGAITDTYDRTGQVIAASADLSPEASAKGEGYVAPKKEIVEKVVSEFVGEQEQIPPMFSAKKINGRKMYELARQGKTVERQPCAINIYSMEVLNYDWPLLKIKIKCSSGTYIRTLAFDLGERLGCGAYVAELVRTKISHYDLTDAVDLAQIKADNYFTFFNKT